jgi:hypothetical protein
MNPAHAKRLHLRKCWNGMSVAACVEHIAQPANMYNYLSAFVARGSTGGHVGKFFTCIQHIGAPAGPHGPAHKFAFSALTCAQVHELLRGLIDAAVIEDMPTTLDENTLNTIMKIQTLVRQDFASQGWSYELNDNYAFRTAYGVNGEYQV